MKEITDVSVRFRVGDRIVDIFTLPPQAPGCLQYQIVRLGVGKQLQTHLRPSEPIAFGGQLYAESREANMY
jgi:hypothetical protein